MPKYSNIAASPTDIRIIGVISASFNRSGGRLIGKIKIKPNIPKKKGRICNITNKKTLIDICLPFSSYEGM